MMNLTFLCVGRLRERFYQDAAKEYLKRLCRYGKFEVIEVDDLPEPVKPSAALEKMLLEKEGDRILRKIRPNDLVIVLEIEGPQMDSTSFANFLRRQCEQCQGRLVLVIGGSLGLSSAVQSRANAKLSLSKMTFPHQLARVLLLEQVYRAQKILAGERYHK